MTSPQPAQTIPSRHTIRIFDIRRMRKSHPARTSGEGITKCKRDSRTGRRSNHLNSFAEDHSAQFKALRVVDSEHGNRRAPGLCAPHEHGAMPREVASPLLSPRVEESHDLPGQRISPAQVRGLCRGCIDGNSSIGCRPRPSRRAAWRRYARRETRRRALRRPEGDSTHTADPPARE
jgi:hypothetical protein